MINNNKPQLWKRDIIDSVDMYNAWFIDFAPKAFKDVREQTAEMVKITFKQTDHLKLIKPEFLVSHPEVLPILRMSTCPPLARDRLIGLSGTSKNLVKQMEDPNAPRVPPRMSKLVLHEEISKISNIILQLLDYDIIPWIKENRNPDETEIYRASTVIADRLCGSMTNPIIRNAQEERQLGKLITYMLANGYTEKSKDDDIFTMRPGTFAIHINVPVSISENKSINVSVDFAFVPKAGRTGELPILIEAKSAGDFTNVNKRRKEEATKMQQLRTNFGLDVTYILYLTGYFDTGYLGYEAAEGIDWIWEHRIEDLSILI